MRDSESVPTDRARVGPCPKAGTPPLSPFSVDLSNGIGIRRRRCGVLSRPRCRTILERDHDGDGDRSEDQGRESESGFRGAFEADAEGRGLAEAGQ